MFINATIMPCLVVYMWPKTSRFTEKIGIYVYVCVFGRVGGVNIGIIQATWSL